MIKPQAIIERYEIIDKPKEDEYDWEAILIDLSRLRRN